MPGARSPDQQEGWPRLRTVHGADGFSTRETRRRSVRKRCRCRSARAITRARHAHGCSRGPARGEAWTPVVAMAWRQPTREEFSASCTRPCGVKLAHQPMEGFPVSLWPRSLVGHHAALVIRGKRRGPRQATTRCSSLDACGENNETSVRGSNATRRVERSGRGAQMRHDVRGGAMRQRAGVAPMIRDSRLDAH